MTLPVDGMLFLSGEFVFSAAAELLLYICGKSVNHDYNNLKVAGLKH